MATNDLIDRLNRVVPGLANHLQVRSVPSQSQPDHYTIQQNLGVSFWNRSLLQTAFTHSSYLNEHSDENLECNERLEFLGDAALGLAIAEALYKKDADIQEGALTLMRQSIVNGKTLARTARALGIGEYLLMGSGEEKSGGRNRNSNLAAAYEAVVGAIFEDKGYDAAKSFCIRTLTGEIDSAYTRVTSAPKQLAKTKSANKPKQSKKAKKPATAGKHPKSALQEISQAKHGKPPAYSITKATGKSNAMTFTAKVQVNGKTLGSGTGSSKKDAETAAAEAALKKLT